MPIARIRYGSRMRLPRNHGLRLPSDRLESRMDIDFGHGLCGNLPDASGTAAEEIYQYKLREISRVGEISFAIRHGAHLLHKIDEIIIAGQHERIDHDSGFATGLNFLESFRHHQRIAAHRVLIKTTGRALIGFFNSTAERSLYETGRRLAVSHHHNLLHLFALRL